MKIQIKGKILTIAGIVLIFGYFIKDSLISPYDPSQVIMVGSDTLGRDWGAMAEQIAKNQIHHTNNDSIASITSETSRPLLDPNDDPYAKPKLNQENYSTIQSLDGREIITGYNRPEDEEDQDNSDDGQGSRIQTRHQKEKKQGVEEPDMIYKE